MLNQSPKKPLPIDKHVGARIKERRLLLGMIQVELSRAAGLTFQQIQKYEGGVNRVSASRLVQFANLLRVSPGYFFEGAPDLVIEDKTSTEVAFAHSPEGAKIVRAMARIKDPALRSAAVASVEAISRVEKSKAQGAAGKKGKG